MRLRSIELQVADDGAATQFLTAVWGLVEAARRGSTTWLRGVGDHPYLISITAAATPAVTAMTYSGSAPEIDEVFARVAQSGAPHAKRVAAFDEPGAGAGFVVRGPESQTYRLVVETAPVATLDGKDRPVQLAHTVLNTIDVGAAARFAIEVLGFRLSDRTAHMAFVRCNRKHHSIAFAHADLSSLNHIAFEMADLDAVMRGIGRLKDAGYEPVWGPGRHGPGNNVFGYFIAPFNAVIEYTAEISDVDESYRVGRPEDWKWPPGRIDHWGVSKKDTAKTAVAERTFRFPATFA